jgi:hypothetical protein
LKYLLDTCVISEYTKKDPAINIIKWISSVDNQNLYLSVLTIGEIKKGLIKLENESKKKELQLWLDDKLLPTFGENILNVDIQVINIWSKINGEYSKKGIVLPVIDSLLVATSMCHNLVFVTRNIKDIKIKECNYFNPWDQ